ncbi:MAG: efflux RND transporter periplasmic adaptor subunit [bacterium]
MKRLIIVSLLISAVFLTSCSQETEKKTEKSVPVKIYKVMPENIGSFLKITGNVTAGEDAVVFAKVSEKIEKIFVKPGDRISQGQTIAAQYNAIYKQGVEAAETAVKTADTQLNQVKQDYERMKKLFDQKAISPQQYDQIKTQNESAELGLNQAKVQLKQAKEQYEYCFIKAPFSGIVASIYVDPGQMLMAGQPVAQVINSNSMKAKIKVPSEDISKVFKSQPVQIMFPSVPNKTFDGIISQIDQAVDPISKNLQVEVLIKNADANIKSGMFGDFLIETSVKKDCIVVPENAIQSRTEVIIDRQTGVQNSIRKYFAFTVKDGKADLVEVITGISNDGRIEIQSGLNIGDVIIVMGQNIVKTGDKVKIIE